MILTVMLLNLITGLVFTLRVVALSDALNSRRIRGEEYHRRIWAWFVWMVVVVAVADGTVVLWILLHR